MGGVGATGPLTRGWGGMGGAYLGGMCMEGGLGEGCPGPVAPGGVEREDGRMAHYNWPIIGGVFCFAYRSAGVRWWGRSGRYLPGLSTSSTSQDRKTTGVVRKSGGPRCSAV